MTRLLTLMGTGGSGKTRLALEVARDLTGAYVNGVWLVELAPLSEGELVPQTVARALGMREQPGRPLADTLAEFLREKQTLLVLDNCEHLADSVASLLDTLLDACPRLRVMATSREALGLAGEILWRVSSLAVPDQGSLASAAELAGYDSVRLFLERARLHLPNFDLTPSNMEAVAEVCEKLEGIPLAIELATARVGALSVKQISRRLRDPLALLSAGGRTAGSRHQTLRGTLDWSYELLSEPEQLLFGRLSVFAGGWTLEAAELVGRGEGTGEGDVLNLLSRLVDKSLVESETLVEDRPRYRMLEPIRQYASEDLERRGEAETVRRRHAEVFLALAELAEPKLQGGKQKEWFERLETEHDNLQTAIAWSLQRRETELALRLSGALGDFWNIRGYLSEGRRWLEAALQQEDTIVPKSRAKVLARMGWLALVQGDQVAAKSLVENSLILYRQLGDKDRIAITLVNLGFVAVLGQQDFASVSALLEETTALKSEVTNRRTLAYLLAFEGLVMVRQVDEGGNFTIHDEGTATRFRALQEESLALFREVEDVRGVSVCLTSLGMAELALANYDRALTWLRELLRLSRMLDDRLSTQYALFGLGGVAASRNQLVRATRLWASADAVREASNISLPPLAHALSNYEGHLAAVSVELGEEAFDEAWTEGRVMALEQAVGYALSEGEPTFMSPPTGEGNLSGEPQPTLTRRELEVARLISRGFTNRRIASELSISEHTVTSHVAKIHKKLMVHSRSQVASWITRQGL